jgi:hypothetical protein
VAAKLLKRSDEIALGDFRTEIAILRKIHHPNTTQVREQVYVPVFMRMRWPEAYMDGWMYYTGQAQAAKQCTRQRQAA